MAIGYCPDDQGVLDRAIAFSHYESSDRIADPELKALPATGRGVIECPPPSARAQSQLWSYIYYLWARTDGGRHVMTPRPAAKALAGIPLAGMKGRMLQTCAAMGRVQLRQYDDRAAEIRCAPRHAPPSSGKRC